MDKLIIPARCCPDTHEGYRDAVEFDAYEWFESATDAQIEALDAIPSGTDEKREALNAIGLAAMRKHEGPDNDVVTAILEGDPFKTYILGSALGAYLAGRKMLAWLESVAYGYSSRWAFESKYPGVVFTDSGTTRFAMTAGWILGVARVDRPLGLTLAREFDYAFRNLSSDLTDYEVRSQYRLDEVDGTVKILSQKVIVSDDGTFGGFSLGWYYPLRSNAVREKAIELDPDAYTSEDGRQWYKALDNAKVDLRVRADLQESRSYWPNNDVVTEEVETETTSEGLVETWTKKVHSAVTMSRVFVEYAYAYNGAMIYRGPGRTAEPFVVNLGSERLWTVHT